MSQSYYTKILSYNKFLNLNEFINMEIVGFILTLLIITMTFIIMLIKFRWKIYSYEKIYFIIYNSTSCVFILYVFILHLTELFNRTQGTTFNADEAVIGFYKNILGFGSLFYELIILLLLYLAIKIVFFFKIRKSGN